MVAARGVDVRETSIRLTFTWQGELQRPTIKVNGVPIKPTAANIKYANRLMAEIRARILAGTFSLLEYFPPEGTVARGGTVGHQLDYWLGLQIIEKSTKAGYLSAIKFWKVGLGDKVMVALRHSDVLRALRRKPLHGKTQKNYISVLFSALDLAVKDELLLKNPAEDIKHADWQKDPPDPFDLHEAEKIIAFMQAKHPPEIYNMVEWRFFSGVRTSEMVGLNWPAVDFNKAQVEIREAVVAGERKDTKTKVARLVDMNSRALAALKRQKDHTFLAGGAVWLDPRYGTAWVDERAFRRSYWTPALKALGIRYRPPNNMRHTYATMLLMAGATPAYGASQMGHSIEMFLNTYARWIAGGSNDREQAKLESFIGSRNFPGTSPETETGT